jgi:membrane protease YdiL (CAAX protease family)
MWVDVGVFLAVTFLGGGLLVAVQPALGIDLVVIEIVQFAPALGVLAVMALHARRPREQRVVRVSVGLSRAVGTGLAVAVGVGAAVAAALAAVGAATTGRVAVISPEDLPAPVLLVVAAQFIGAAAEEVGWRCYLQPRLQGRFGLLPAAVAVGLLWGCWHVQVFAESPLYMGSFLLACVAMSVLLAVLLDGGPRGNLLVSGVFHALVNLAMLAFAADEAGAAGQAALAAVCTLAAAIALAVHRRRGTAARPGRPPRT